MAVNDNALLLSATS